jgi:class 3 adenylate cyclase
MTLQEIKSTEAGTVLKYTGKGFIGFSKNNREVEFVCKAPEGVYDIWVKYDGYNVLVRIDEVEKLK